MQTNEQHRTTGYNRNFGQIGGLGRCQAPNVMVAHTVFCELKNETVSEWKSVNCVELDYVLKSIQWPPGDCICCWSNRNCGLAHSRMHHDECGSRWHHHCTMLPEDEWSFATTNGKFQRLINVRRSNWRLWLTTPWRVAPRFGAGVVHDAYARIAPFSGTHSITASSPIRLSVDNATATYAGRSVNKKLKSIPFVLYTSDCICWKPTEARHQFEFIVFTTNDTSCNSSAWFRFNASLREAKACFGHTAIIVNWIGLTVLENGENAIYSGIHWTNEKIIRTSASRLGLLL